jgi:hypothetical protein
MACPVVQVFCIGCRVRPTCRIARRPKVRPDVRRFLSRFKVAREMHQPLWTTSYKELPVKEWALICRALNVVSECELESVKKFKRNSG